MNEPLSVKIWTLETELPDNESTGVNDIETTKILAMKDHLDPEKPYRSNCLQNVLKASGPFVSYLILDLSQC